jgi:hypothetical protein
VGLAAGQHYFKGACGGAGADANNQLTTVTSGDRLNITMRLEAAVLKR